MPVKAVLTFALLAVSITVQAQHLKIDNGALLSRFSNKADLPFLDSRVAHYAGAIGMDYLERKWFSLSSQIGYTRIGGRERNLLLPEELREIKETQSYVHLNTTFRAHAHAESIASTFFVGLGPTVDLRAGSRNFESSLYEGYRCNTLRFGSKTEIGIIREAEKIRIGVVGGYLFDLTPAAKTDFLSLYSNAFSVMITAGYRLK